MNRLHDIDELFLSALEGHEDTPSEWVKESLEAVLDKQGAESNKRKFFGWKRAAILISMLLARFALYDSRISVIDAGHSDKNTININMAPAFFVKNKKAHPITNASITNNQRIGQRNEETVYKGIEDSAVPVITAIINSPLQKEKINSFQSFRHNAVSTINTQQAGNLILAQLPAVNDLPAKSSTPMNEQAIKLKTFRPYWIMSGYASYDLAGYRLDSDEPNAISSIKHREAHEPSYSGSILLTRQLTPRWGLQSGLTYSKIAIGMTAQKTYAFQDAAGDIAYKYITSSGYAFIKPGSRPQPLVGDSLSTAEAKHTITNFSLPVMMKYTVLNKKVSFIPGAGIEANFITKANLEVDVEDVFNQEILVVRKLNGNKLLYWSFVADAELRYNISKRLSVTVDPVYRRAIVPFTKNNVVETYPHNVGIGAGITVKL